MAKTSLTEAVRTARPDARGTGTRAARPATAPDAVRMLSLRLPAPALNQLKALAALEGLSLKDWVTRALNEALAARKADFRF